MPLTTRQRDILRILISEKKPISSAELAGQLNISQRQVNYSLQGIRTWLNQRDHALRMVPGAGFQMELPPEQVRALFQEINLPASMQIILSVSQRQQLLAAYLLTTAEPAILSQLEQKTQVSRVTIMKDLDEIEHWLNRRSLTLVRKPHFGAQIAGAEAHIQQALAELTWGETHFSGNPVVQITHAEGLVFLLEGDIALLPLVAYCAQMLEQVDLRRAISLTAKAEELLGGRFTDDAVLHLALVMAITAQRARIGHHITIEAEQVDWLAGLPIWRVASFLSRRFAADTRALWQPGDTAWIAMQLMAAPRNEILPGEIEQYGDFNELIERVMLYISHAFGVSKLKHDRTLQNGLLNHIVPACFRERFQLWFPAALSATDIPPKNAEETEITAKIAAMVFDQTGLPLPQSEVDNLVVLLRAAIIRNSTYRFERVFVVCPSGMATAQLLVARLHARFPHLNGLEVVSLRDLTPALLQSADMVLTTVSLPRQFASSPKVIRVHPLLMPEDIEAITQFLR